MSSVTLLRRLRNNSHKNRLHRAFRELGRVYQNACDIMAAANSLAADGHPVDPDDVATISPYITHTIRRFGDWVLDLSPPDRQPVTRLELLPGHGRSAGRPADITIDGIAEVTAAVVAGLDAGAGSAAGPGPHSFLLAAETMVSTSRTTA